MRKYIKILLIILILMSLVLPLILTFSYAMDKIQEGEFFEVSNIKVSKKENIEMIINLEQINYNKFMFELKSDENISNIDIKEEVETVKGDNEISMEIDKKNNGLKSITLYYAISDEKIVGDKIKFIATIKNCENEEETQSVEIEIEIIEKQDIENSEDNENEENTQKPENNENQEETTKPENGIANNQEQGSNMQNIGTKVTDSSATKIEQPSSSDNINSNISKVGIANSSQNIAETVIYNGSSNNYLSNLIVENYDLNKEFSKENSTYFIEVENDVNTLNIIAEPEDDDGTVCIYGNEDLEQGSNKILISVTAENGNVRNYRIYVTKKA